MAFEFQSASHKTVYDKVAVILKDQFGKQVTVSEAAPTFNLRAGSSWVTVTVASINEKFTLVRSYCWVVTGAETTAELSKFLLEETFGMRFGAFALEPGTGDILFTHAIMGEGCDADELLWSLMAVVNVSDEYDDKITQRFGGQRAVDRK